LYLLNISIDAYNRLWSTIYAWLHLSHQFVSDRKHNISPLYTDIKGVNIVMCSVSYISAVITIIGKCPKILCKNPKCNVTWKYVEWELGCSTRTVRRIDRRRKTQYETDGRFSQYFTIEPKKIVSWYQRCRFLERIKLCGY